MATAVEDAYVLGEKIGTGAFSDVFRATSRTEPDEIVAIKQIKKVKVKNKEDITREIEVLQSLNHPHVVRLLGVYDTPDFCYLALEYLSGGELFDRIVERGSYTEMDAARLIRQVLGAIDYLHCQNIVHRDLKPENLLCDSRDDDARIVINDFGLARTLADGEKLSHPCGTPGYAAPEVLLRRPYDYKADCFSVGVIAYILLCGYPPFFSETDDNQELFDLTVKGLWEFDSPDWDDMSKGSKDYITGLMQLDPEVRWSSREALEHPWVRGESASSHDIHRRVSENFARYFAKKRWRMAFNAHRSINRFKLLAKTRSEQKSEDSNAMELGSGANSPANVPGDNDIDAAAVAASEAEASATSASNGTLNVAQHRVQPRLMPSFSISNISDGENEEEESITLVVPRVGLLE